MNINVAQAKDRFTELLRAVEGGERITITRNGKPVAQLTAAPPARGQIRLGGMKHRIHFRKGWDAPVNLSRFLKGGL